jgi:hypothetical protein
VAHIEFTDNYEDLSTETGFQFKFICETCGNGYMSSWHANKTGIAGGLLRGAGNMLGGILGRAGAGSYEIQEAIGGPAHDNALKEAVAEIRPLFTQCKRCGQWVCRDVCWNDERGLCKTCAPIAQREISAMQASLTVEQAEAKLRTQDLTEGLNLTSPAAVLCPKCGAESDGGKFCSECGAPMRARDECGRCGTKFKEGTKFCPECGAKVG